MSRIESEGRRKPLPPEPPPASSDPGVGPPSFPIHPFWEPVWWGFVALVLGACGAFLLFGLAPLIMADVGQARWLAAASSLFGPVVLLALLLLSFGTGKLLERLGVFRDD